MTGNVDSGVNLLMRLLSTKRLAHEVPNSAPSLNERGSLQPDRHTPVTAKCPTHRIRVIALSICSQGTTKGFQLCYFKTFCRKFRKSWGKKTTKTTDIRVKVEHKRNLLKAKMQNIFYRRPDLHRRKRQHLFAAKILAKKKSAC